ncbi:MAG: hypothetical protein GMKNLPBB_03220 [Myxococcota bacterium]|nr:hypothetical protein [Myxococcota bacterium]
MRWACVNPVAAHNPEIDALAAGFEHHPEKVIETIYRQYRRHIYAIALRMTASPAMADDILQDVMVKIYAILPKYKPQGNFSGWIGRVTVNQCLDHLRRRQRSLLVPDENSAVRRSPSDRRGEHPDSATEDEELRGKIEQALQKLPPKQRAAVILHDIQGFEKHEVAEMLECAESSVRTHLQLGRAKLRLQLSHYLERPTGPGESDPGDGL